MLAAAILDFKKFQFLTAGTLERPNLRVMPSFMKIGRSVAETRQFFKMAAVYYLK